MWVIFDSNLQNKKSTGFTEVHRLRDDLTNKELQKADPIIY